MRDASPDTGELLAVATHELRAPLTALLGFASTLRDGWERLPDTDRARCVDAIDRQAHRLAAMVDDLFGAALAESGAGRCDVAPVSVADAIGDACIDAGVERTHELIVKLPPALPSARADHEWLRRIIVNLLVNAGRYSRRGSRIEVSATATAGNVTIAVRDHGRGIPPELRDHLFDMYSRTDDGPRMSSGIGLYVVRRLADQMGATIAVDSEVGVGTTFTITMARADGADVTRVVTPLRAVGEVAAA